MGQHKFNPVAIAAKRGEIAPKAKPAQKLAATDLRRMKAHSTGSDRRAIRRDAREKADREATRLFFRYLTRRASTPILPPQSGHRRPEFSSSIRGQWSAD